MNKIIRWGVIGCGSVTELKSTPAFQKVEGFDVACVMGRSEDKVRDYAHRHAIKNYTTSLTELIKQSDAIYIATPPDSHLEYAQHVLQAGLPCCIEKPISNNTYAARKTVDAFQAAGVPLFVSYYRRSLPRFLKVKSWLEDKKIGTVRHISWNFCKPTNDLDRSQASNWRTHKNIAPGGYFEDLASHGFDLFNDLLGPIETANGLALNQQALYSANDAVTGHWLHPNKVTGSGFWNFGAFERGDNVEIMGDKGKISFSVFLEEPLRLTTNETSLEEFIENPENIQFFHAQNIWEHLTQGKQHPSTGETALHANWVMDQMLGRKL